MSSTSPRRRFRQHLASLIGKLCSFSSPLLLACGTILLFLAALAVHRRGGHAAAAAWATPGGGGRMGPMQPHAEVMAKARVSAPGEAMPSTASPSAVSAPSKTSVMSDEALAEAVRQHHPLNRLECGSWPEAYARLHSNILAGRAPQVRMRVNCSVNPRCSANPHLSSPSWRAECRR